MFRGNSAMVRGKAHNAVAFFIQYQQNTLQETIFLRQCECSRVWHSQLLGSGLCT